MYCYVANPASGTFSVSWSGGTVFQYSIFTLQDAAQTNPIDAAAVNYMLSSGSSVSGSVTTTQGNGLILDNVIGAKINITHTFGANETQAFMGGSDPLGMNSVSYKPGQSSAGTEIMTRTFSPNDDQADIAVVAIKAGPPMAPPSGFATTSVYTYGTTGYANPDAVSLSATDLNYHVYV